MNSDVPSSENKLSQDDSTENAVSSQTSNEASNSVEIAEEPLDPNDNPELKNNSIDQANSESSTISDSKIKAQDTEARLQQLEKEHETLNSQYMRIAADFDNFRKRQSRDQDDLKIQLTCTTLSEILPVVDNFERARQ